jgi:hypothetical protein
MRLARRGAARFLFRFVILGAAAGTLAGWSAHVIRSAASLPAASDDSQSVPTAWQIANREAKADRLPLVQVSLASRAGNSAALPADPSPSYALAYAAPTGDLDRPRHPATMPTGSIEAQPVAGAATAEPVVATAPLPPQRPKRLPPPAPESGLLDDAHIAGIKGRLHLTAEQEEHWPAVEAALREVGRTQLRQAMKRANGGKPQIDVNSPEVQRLIWAAMPLLRQLREDQKREVRNLARVIGLHSVASQI